MKLKTNGAAVQVVGAPVLTADGCTVTVAEPVEVGADIVLEADDGALLREYAVADYLRCVVDGCTVRLTNTPEPPPAPPPDELAQARAAQRTAIAEACEADIYAGVDVTTSDGVTGHYAFTIEDQINLDALYTLCRSGEAGAPYHADGQACKVYPAADIIAIGDALLAHKIYDTTYCNHLFQWLDRCETVEQVRVVEWGAQLPDDLAAHMQEVLAGAQTLVG